MKLIDISLRTIKSTLCFKSINVVVTGFFLILGSQASYAEDLLDLWKVAELNDSKYLSAAHKHLSDQEIVYLSRSELMPQISLQYEHKNTEQQINKSDNLVFDGSYDSYPTKVLGLTLTQAVFNHARWQSYLQSEISSDRAQVEYRVAKQDLLLRLAENYFLVLERADQLETLQAEKAAMFKHLTTSEKRHASGLGRRADIEEARARYLSALSTEVELQSRAVDSRYALREVLGREPGELSRLDSNFELVLPVPSDANEWVKMSVLRNLELQSMNFALQIADKEISVLRAGHYPTVDVVLNRNNTDVGGSVFGGGSNIDNTDLTLQLNIPIYSGGKTSARFRQAVEKRASAYHDRNEKKRLVERSAHDAYNRVSAAISKVDALSQSVKAQKTLLRSKTSGYRSGQNSMLEILDVEQALSTAQQSLTKARYDYVLNVLRLKSTAGDLVEDDLILVNGWLAKK